MKILKFIKPQVIQYLLFYEVDTIELLYRE